MTIHVECAKLKFRDYLQLVLKEVREQLDKPDLFLSNSEIGFITIQHVRGSSPYQAANAVVDRRS